MTTTTYDENNWLVTLCRSLANYAADEFGDLVSVEQSFPNTREWAKQNPLTKSVVHFEVDDITDMPWGFGTPGKQILDDDQDPTTVTIEEGQKHHVNFDVGVWCSAQTGGATKRMELVQRLKDLFVPAGAKLAMQTALNGPYPRSFEGCTFILDRVDDIPLWRAMNMTLVVECFSRHVPGDDSNVLWVPQDFTQNQELVIDVDGTLTPLTGGS